MFPGSKLLNSEKFSPRKLTPQKTVSFKVYQLEQKSRLKSLYPFLSADQIKKKIKDQWTTLGQEDRNKYTKVSLKPTPIKGKHKSPKVEKFYDVTRKRKKPFENILNKKPRLDICPTPEYVNTEKLHDFRKVHQENYDNDFSDSPASQESDWTTKGTLTYQSKSFCVNRAAPEVVNDTPCHQAGILKNR